MENSHAHGTDAPLYIGTFRSADLSKLDLNTRSLKTDGVEFTPTNLVNNLDKGTHTHAVSSSHPAKRSRNYAQYRPSGYARKTMTIWVNNTRLFLTVIKPHQAAAFSTTI